MLWEEVIKLLRFSKTAEEINIKREELAAWMPAIRVMFDYDQNSQYHPYDLWMHCVHTVLGIDGKIEDDMLFLAALLHDIGKPLSRCKGNKPDDSYSHYYGHQNKSEQIVREEVIPYLSSKGVSFSQEDMERLLYYVKYHDDLVTIRENHLKRHLDLVDIVTFKNLMELEVADAKAHAMFPIIQKRIDICSEWKDKKADELKVRLLE